MVTSHFSISNPLSIFLLINGDPLLRAAVTVILNALQKDFLSCIQSEVGVSIHSQYQAKKTWRLKLTFNGIPAGRYRLLNGGLIQVNGLRPGLTSLSRQVFPWESYLFLFYRYVLRACILARQRRNAGQAKQDVGIF